MLYDNHNRPINYLRLAVTDRCNLRCFYCMPEEGIHFLPKKELLTFEEIERVVRLMAGMGITKIRLTGGEPFVRNDLMELLRKITSIPGIQDVHLTTNGVLTRKHIPALKQLGIASVNLSLDTLDKQRFHAITHRDVFEDVMDTFRDLVDAGIPVKINAVVMEGKNVEDIVPLVMLAKDKAVSVRFIEEMPFNGEGSHYPVLSWTYQRILSHIQSNFPSMYKIEDPQNSTATHFKVPGFSGDIGIIAAFSRTFCGTCNRIRITAQGDLKTCLYDNGVMSLKQLLRSGMDNTVLQHALLRTFSERPKDGREAEERRKTASVFESMSTIGG